MDKAVQQRLLALNREFYATVAEPFDATRLGALEGTRELVRRLALAAKPHLTLSHPALADIGCGNGRLAWLLDEQGIALDYVGMDANAQLLALAKKHTAHLRHVQTRFVQADLAQADWPALLPTPRAGFDFVTCLATLHHIPGYDLRRTIMQQLASLVAPDGLVAISTWQFLTTPRFITRRIDWASIGVDADAVEPGDWLLPWQQDVYAVRYVHQIDLDEVTALAADAGLALEDTYRADGKEGNLNLYALLRRVPDAPYLGARSSSDNHRDTRDAG